MQSKETVPVGENDRLALSVVVDDCEADLVSDSVEVGNSLALSVSVMVDETDTLRDLLNDGDSEEDCEKDWVDETDKLGDLLNDFDNEEDCVKVGVDETEKLGDLLNVWVNIAVSVAVVVPVKDGDNEEDCVKDWVDETEKLGDLLGVVRVDEIDKLTESLNVWLGEVDSEGVWVRVAEIERESDIESVSVNDDDKVFDAVSVAVPDSLGVKEVVCVELPDSVRVAVGLRDSEAVSVRELDLEWDAENERVSVCGTVSVLVGDKVFDSVWVKDPDALGVKELVALKNTSILVLPDRREKWLRTRSLITFDFPPQRDKVKCNLIHHVGFIHHTHINGVNAVNVNVNDCRQHAYGVTILAPSEVPSADTRQGEREHHDCRSRANNNGIDATSWCFTVGDRTAVKHQVLTRRLVVAGMVTVSEVECDSETVSVIVIVSDGSGFSTYSPSTSISFISHPKYETLGASLQAIGT
eukprot:gene20987-biopygen1750